MNRFIPIIHGIIAVLQTNNWNENYFPRTAQKVLGHGLRTFQKSQKIHWTDSQKIAREGDRKHMCVVQIQLSHEMLLKIHDKVSPK